MNDLFVDREEEISKILNYVKIKTNILIYGLRGIGKTTLLEAVKKILERENREVIFIDGYTVLSPEDISSMLGEFRGLDARNAIDILLEKDEKIIIIDEFTALLKTLSKYDPFSNIDEVIKYLRSRIQSRRKRGGNSILLSSSAPGFVKRITMKYYSPLFREFKIMHIGPMNFKAIAELATKKGISEEEAREVAYYASGNPFYALKIIEHTTAHKTTPREAVFKLIETGEDLDIYYTALLENLSVEERYILHLIARGISRFYEIENKLYKDPYPYLKRLEDNGIITKIKKGKKHSTYTITDKILQSWLQNQEIPSLGKMSKEAITVSSLGFEAMLREALRAITTQIKIKDHLGQELELKPFKTVFNYKGKDYEVDAIGVLNNEAYIFEAHFWGEARYDKIKQLKKNAEKVAEELGKEIKEKILASYFGFKLTENEKKKIKQEKIKLLTAKELREIQKKIKINLGF